MNSTDISFPNLGIYLNNVPKSFDFFSVRIAFYGVIIGIGVLAGIFLADRLAKKAGEKADLIYDFAIYAIIFSLIGARLYYVAFQWDSYKNNLLEIFNTRNGGMAIYGGVIAAVLTCYIYCKIKKISFPKLADYCVPGLILGQAIGRWGNFTNREVFGQYTDSLFAMRLPIAAVRSCDISDSIRAHMTQGENYIQVHPTFLYESVWNLLVLVLLLVYQKHKKFDGEQLLLYMAGYGLGRFVIEGIRTDRLFLWNTQIAVSQVVAAAMVIIAVLIDLVIRLKQKKRETDCNIEQKR